MLFQEAVGVWRLVEQEGDAAWCKGPAQIRPLHVPALSGPPGRLGEVPGTFQTSRGFLKVRHSVPAA